MENTGKEVSSDDSSLLLKFPMSLFTPNPCDENILLPVGVPENSDVTGSAGSSKNYDSLDISDSMLSSSICQLEQPLLFRGMSQQSQAIPYISDCAELDNTAASNLNRCGSLAQSTIGGSTTVSPYSSHECQSLYSGHASQEPSAPLSLFKPHSGSNYGADVLEPVPTYPTVPSFPTAHLIPIHFTADGFSDSDSDFSGDNILQADGNVQFSSDTSFEHVKPYWLFQDTVESKEIWYGFSEFDSEKLEKAYQRGLEYVVATDGGRYDVYLQNRIKKSVYFEAKELHVRRCTWFYQQGSSMRFKPYDENTADYLEEFYRDWVTSGVQETRFVIPGFIGNFVFEKPQVLLHYGIDSNTWNSPNEPKGSPKVVKRGLPEGFQIMPNESPQIDHLLFVVQGIGSFCDLRFRTVSECVDGFRDIATKLIESHFKKQVDQGHVGRVEILPVAWHAKLRTNDIGLDRTMKMITLPSIPKLRHFTNDTLIDILLYSSPSYCQSILNTVAEELNDLYYIFLARNRNFSGKVFVAGHSLGSLILFDILSNQNPSEYNAEKEATNLEEKLPRSVCNTFENYSSIDHLLQSLELEDYEDIFKSRNIELSSLPYLSYEDLNSLGLPIGPCQKLMNFMFPEKNHSTNESSGSDKSIREIFETNKTEDKTFVSQNRMVFPLQKPNTDIASIIYPRLFFYPAAFFAMGSPISMFLATRGFDTISDKYSFPTCPAFFHIFHPYDPVAFRIEPMIDHSFTEKPVLIPHHKGRKRMHLEIKENVSKFASELRQKVMDTLHKTWNSLNEITRLHPFPSAVMENEVNSMVSHEIPEITTYDDQTSLNISIGNLNKGRRIDYVLQEKPLEALNDYVWALTSHATYWDSEDTVLMILREIYAIQGINVSPQSEHDTFVQESSPENDVCATNRDYLPFSKEFLEKTIYSHLPTGDTLPVSTANSLSSACTTSTVTTVESAPFSPPTSGASICVPGSQHIGPPPLSGFVKRSPFTK